MGFLNSIFGTGTDREKIKSLLDRGAEIIDVRTRGEFQGGHVAGSKNIPMQEIQQHTGEFKDSGKPLVLCCASGNRSGQVAQYLKSQGIECENGGGWREVNAIVNE